MNTRETIEHQLGLSPGRLYEHQLGEIRQQLEAAVLTLGAASVQLSSHTLAAPGDASTSCVSVLSRQQIQAEVLAAVRARGQVAPGSYETRHLAGLTLSNGQRLEFL